MRLRKKRTLSKAEEAEIVRLFHKYLPEWDRREKERQRQALEKEKVKIQPKPELREGPGFYKGVRSILHFAEDYGRGMYSPGYTEYMIQHGFTVWEPKLWLLDREVSKAFRLIPKKLKLKERPKKLRLKNR